MRRTVPRASALIYLDSSTLQIPVDPPGDHQQLARRKGVRRLLLMAREQKVGLVWSPPLEYECITRAPIERLPYCQAVRSLTSRHAEMTPEVIARARQFQVQARLGSYDALHLAAAESMGATLVTEDKKFRSRAQSIDDLRIQVVDTLTMLANLDDD